MSPNVGGVGGAGYEGPKFKEIHGPYPRLYSHVTTTKTPGEFFTLSIANPTFISRSLLQSLVPHTLRQVSRSRASFVRSPRTIRALPLPAARGVYTFELTRCLSALTLQDKRDFTQQKQLIELPHGESS